MRIQGQTREFLVTWMMHRTPPLHEEAIMIANLLGIYIRLWPVMTLLSPRPLSIVKPSIEQLEYDIAALEHAPKVGDISKVRPHLSRLPRARFKFRSRRFSSRFCFVITDFL